VGRGQSFVRYFVRSFDGAVPEVGDDALVPGSPELGWSLVVGQEGERAFAVQIQCSLQSRKQRHKRLSWADYGSAPVGDEVATASEEEL
jgi:hypothetical protein